MSIQNQPTAEQFAVIQAVANFSAKPMRTPILGGVLKSMLTLNEAIIDVKEG